MYVIYINVHTRKYRIVEASANTKKTPDEIRIGNLHTKADAERIVKDMIKQ
jgi:hypothetical protein